MNGYDYRGRKLAVSYSRQRSEGENAETAEESAATAEVQKAAAAVLGADQITVQEMAAEDAAAYAAAEKAAADKTPFGV